MNRESPLVWGFIMILEGGKERKKGYNMITLTLWMGKERNECSL